MKTSETTKQIDNALIAFQSEMEGVGKGAVNPFFKKKYSDLASILKAIKPLMGKYRLSLTQSVSHKEGNIIVIYSRVAHESGEWILSSTPIFLSKLDPQATGAGITYGRRYGIQAVLNLSAVDDDGESAMKRTKKTKTDADYTITNANEVI